MFLLGFRVSVFVYLLFRDFAVSLFVYFCIIGGLMVNDFLF